jgi:FKBP-type peptidyl-prolyl cis-trans isomerase FklB
VEAGRKFKRQGLDVDLAQMTAGMMAAQAGGKLLLTDAEIRTTMNSLSAELKPNKAAGEPVATAGSPSEGAAAQVFKTRKEKVGYCLGVETTRNFAREGFDGDLALVSAGIKDAMTGEKLLLTDKAIMAALNLAANSLRRDRTQQRFITGEDNRKAGAEFLAANKTKEGVVALPSGLQYRILKAGNGRKPAATDTVECRYRGTLIDGTEFDSSGPDGQVATFKVSEVIAGWREALQLMPVGSKWQLFIPSQLAYLQRGSGRYIGPYATLIFELELVGIK